MDGDRAPDDDDLDDLRDPLTPVDLLLPGAWRSPRPDLRAARRPGDGPPLAAPAPVVRTPSTLPLPLGDLDESALRPAAPQPPVNAPMPPLPEWSAAPAPRAVGSRAVLGIAAGLVAVGGVSLWLGLLPTGGDAAPAPPVATLPGAAVVPASEPSTAAPSQAPTTASPKATTKAAPRTSTSRAPAKTRTTRAGTVVVRASAYVGRPAREAQQALRRLGLKVEVRLVATAGRRRPGGTVVSVSPTGRVRAGSTVVVVVAV